MPEIDLQPENHFEENSHHVERNIPIVDNDVTYSDFFWKYLWKNRPCIIRSVTKNWGSTAHWINNNRPDFEYLAHEYGSYSVPVVDCDLNPNSDCVKKLMLFSEYINYWKDLKLLDNARTVSYLKDWHLRKDKPNDNFYTVPEYFSSDWLNEYSLDKNIDDFMFVYMGPKGTWTSFHADVYSSFSWSANVVGKKRWLLFPPGEELKFQNSSGDVVSDVEKLLNPDDNYFEIIQGPGDAIFVPSGWFHQVYNLEDTISINHNWINSCNINFMWNSLKDNLLLVEKEIAEFKNTEGWSEHCQLMLKASFGTNFDEFLDFVKHIALKRLESFNKDLIIQFDRWNFGKNHILHDLKSLYKLIQTIMCDKIYYNENQNCDLKSIISDIENVL